MRKNVPNTPSPTRRPSPPADALAASVIRGDDDAFEQLHRRLGGGLRNFFQRRLGGQPDRIDELSQVTWVEVWRALRTGRYDPDRARITTFVYAVGYKMLLRHFRATRRDGAAKSAGELDLVLPASVTGPDDELQASELIDAMHDCLTRTGTATSLTDEERAVVAGITGGDTERGLAERLGLAASTVNARKKSAYRKLRNCLARKGFARAVAERPGPKSE